MKRAPLPRRKVPLQNVPPRSRGAKWLQSDWRADCRLARPYRCVAAELGGCQGDLECDHIKPRSQGGPWLVANGAFLCSRHHRMKTDGELQYRFEWLGLDQIAWLASVGWVAWDNAGQPFGNGWRHFAPRAT